MTQHILEEDTVADKKAMRSLFAVVCRLRSGHCDHGNRDRSHHGLTPGLRSSCSMQAALAPVVYLGRIEIMAAGRKFVLLHVGLYIIVRPLKYRGYLDDSAVIHGNDIQGFAMLRFPLRESRSAKSPA